MFQYEEILKMQKPYELFKGDLKEAKQTYIELMKIYHPDLHKGDNSYIEVTSKINSLYKEAIEELENGRWIEPNFIKLKGTDNKNYSMKFKMSHEFELGNMYIGNNAVMYLVDEENSDLIENALSVLKNLRYENESMKKEFEKYIPKVITTFKTTDEKIGMVVKKDEDLICLRDILKYFDEKMDARSVTWILSSLYNISCFLNYNDIAHNGITINNYFISPENHSGALLGGWWYSKKLKEKMLGVSSELYDVMPHLVKESKESSAMLDLEGIRLIGRTLLGDESGIQLAFDKEIPKPLSSWLREISVSNPFEEYTKWNDVIIKSFGERKFIEMKIDKEKLYESLGGN